MKANKGLSKAEAESKARSKSYARHVRTYSRPQEETITELNRIFDLYERIDKTAADNNQLTLLNPEVPAGKKGPPGARTALKNLISCIRKGCCKDPFDLDQM